MKHGASAQPVRSAVEGLSDRAFCKSPRRELFASETQWKDTITVGDDAVRTVDDDVRMVNDVVGMGDDAIRNVRGAITAGDDCVRMYEDVITAGDDAIRIRDDAITKVRAATFSARVTSPFSNVASAGSRSEIVS